MKESGFGIKKLFKDSKTSLLNPKEFFISMAGEGGFLEPVIKVTIFGAISGLIAYIWSLLNIIPKAMAGIAGSNAGIIIILLSHTTTALIIFFILGIILLIISAICGGTTRFEPNIKVIAATAVLFPVSSFLNILSGIHIYPGMIVGFLIVLYGIWMVYNALITVLEAKEGAAKTASMVLGALVFLIMIGSITCFKAATEISDMYKKESEKFMRNNPNNEELQKNMQKWQENLKKMQEQNK